MIYFTSDIHFNHSKSFLYEPRGFSSIEEHDEQIIKNWNAIVKPEDTVYVLGDMCLGGSDVQNMWENMSFIEQLNGQLHIIRGNHDTDHRVNMYRECENVVAAGEYATIIKYGKYHFYLSHYPTKVGNYDDEEKHTKLYCLCGHSHVKDKWLDWHDKCYHVELDAHGNMPVSIDQIIEDIKEKING